MAPHFSEPLIYNVPIAIGSLPGVTAGGGRNISWFVFAMAAQFPLSSLSSLLPSLSLPHFIAFRARPSVPSRISTICSDRAMCVSKCYERTSWTGNVESTDCILFWAFLLNVERTATSPKVSVLTSLCEESSLERCGAERTSRVESKEGSALIITIPRRAFFQI